MLAPWFDAANKRCVDGERGAAAQHSVSISGRGGVRSRGYHDELVKSVKRAPPSSGVERGPLAVSSARFGDDGVVQSVVRLAPWTRPATRIHHTPPGERCLALERSAAPAAQTATGRAHLVNAENRQPGGGIDG
jgi:hypothetical protein